MITVLPTQFAGEFSLGVRPIDSVQALKQVIEEHTRQHGARFCPLFVAIASMRLSRWVGYRARQFVIKTEPDQVPEVVDETLVMNTNSIGRYISEGKLFYDSLSLELPSNPRVMQRLS